MRSGRPAAGIERRVLSPLERERLCEYACRYNLEAEGFTAAEARRLLFLRWLHRHRLVGEEQPQRQGTRDPRPRP